jgi:hypothetical protein
MSDRKLEINAAASGFALRATRRFTDLSGSAVLPSFRRILHLNVMNRASRLYLRYAVAMLVLTLLAGALLRASFVWPAWRVGHGPHVLHAHSHVGFFGWAVMAVCAVVTARIRITEASATVHRVLAHAIGIGSAAAFVGFAQRGYDMTTITISAVHVLLWVVFVAAVWRPLGALAANERRYLRTGLAFLATAGMATIAPVLMMVRVVSEPWLLQMGVKLFLTPFVTGFLLITALGLLYSRIRGSKWALPALWLVALGTLPSTLLYVTAAPPAPWLLWVGRGGMGMVGAGLLCVVFDVAYTRLAQRGESQPGLPPVAALALSAVAVAGAVKLLAALGVGAAFMHSRNIVVAVLHLVLLGVVTPSFILALRPTLRAPRRTAAYAASLFVMLASLAAAGWPWAARTLIARGVQLDTLFQLAAVSGVLATVLLLTLFVPGRSTGAVVRAEPAGRVAA